MRFMKLIVAVLVLLGSVPGFAEEAQSPATSARSTKAAVRPATVLLVTSEKLSSAWKRFAAWKTILGKSTEVITVERIARDYPGADIQAKIRAACLEFIARRGTRWVILGGDSLPGGRGVVPDRDTLHRDPVRYSDIPTDIYYISEKNWDANGDGIYGDWRKDLPAVSYINDRASIGRIPVRTAADVAAYTDKVVAYETRYPTSGFARNFIYTCPEEGAYPKLNTSKAQLAKAWTAGNVRQFFGSHTPWDKSRPGDYDLSPKNWVSMINRGASSKFHMHGHGFLPAWVLENHATLQAEHVARLTNKNALVVMTTVSCFTGQYDAAKDPSIAESMLRKAGGGAVAVVAPSREGVPVFHNPARDFRLMISQGKMDATTRTLTNFWKLGLSGNLTAGEALREAKRALVADARKTAGFHFVQCELNLLGDPTLDLRSRDPVTPSLEVPASLAAGTRVLEVITDSPGATVCLWKRGEFYTVLTTGKDGRATATVNVPTPGRLLVSVSGPSLNAALGKVTIK